LQHVVLAVLVAVLLAVPVAMAAQAEADLLVAASRGDVDAVRALLEQGADADATNEYGATPLILATVNGHADVVQALIEGGADAALADTFYGRTPLQWATLGGASDIAPLLLVGGAVDFGMLFLEAVSAGNVDQVAEYLDMQVPAEDVLAEALQRAVAARSEPMAQLLIAAGAVPPPPTIVSVDAERLRLYEGRYADEVGYELLIIADQQSRTLLVRPPGMRNPLRFLPVEESTFISEQSQNMTLRFTVRDGRVVGMAFSQGGVARRMSKQ